MCKYCGSSETHFEESEENGMGWQDSFTIPCCEYQEMIDHGEPAAKVAAVATVDKALRLVDRVVSRIVSPADYKRGKDDIPF